jgi:predicted hydrocarbon binding protein
MQAKLGLEENADVANAAKNAMAEMSQIDRAKVILTYTADTISRQLNTRTWVEQEGDVLYYKDEAATHCFGRTSDTPVCHTATGFVAGMVAWAVDNAEWKVEETECMAMGMPHCTYRVNKEDGGN